MSIEIRSGPSLGEDQAVLALGALAQVQRLRVFRLLVVAGKEGLTPGALAEGLAVPAATLSFHLKELLRAGLISQERQSRHLIYRADFACMDRLLAYLSDNCCQGEACQLAPPQTCC